ncbi:MAG: hypothetical protein RIR79_1024 [Pseudomonadota bacterium]|jgi:uncharacterized membrane protein YfcA
MLDTILILELATLGLFSGFLAGLLGVGGGMMLVPFLTFFLSNQGMAADMSVKMAIATAMATIVFTSISSVRAHHQHGAVRWDMVKGIAPGIVIGGFITSLGLFTLLKGTALAIVFAIFVGFSATQMFLDKKPKPNRQMPGIGGQIAAGSVIGCISGLVGAGGGFISVPFMVAHNIPMRNAVATSAALGLPIAIANTIGYLIGGYVWFAGLLVIACCSVLTAPLGAKAAHTLPVAQLKKVFAAMLYALASYMLWKGLNG